MMPPFVGYGNFLKLPLLKCHQWTLTFISTVDVGNVIHSGAILARQRDTHRHQRPTDTCLRDSHGVTNNL